MKLLWDALDIVKTIYSDYQFDAFEFLLQYGNSLLDLFLSEAFSEFFGIDANWKSANRYDLAFEFNTIGGCCEIQDSGATAQEMARIVVCVKADQVAMENAQEDFIPNRQNSVDLT